MPDPFLALPLPAGRQSSSVRVLQRFAVESTWDPHVLKPPHHHLTPEVAKAREKKVPCSQFMISFLASTSRGGRGGKVDKLGRGKGCFPPTTYLTKEKNWHMHCGSIGLCDAGEQGPTGD